MGSIGTKKPHAVCVPCPAQGHINPMLKVAKLLHYKGFHITFVNTEFNHHHLLKSRGPHSLNGFPDFQFETIPDGLPPSDIDATQDIPPLCDSTSKNCLVPFRNLLSKLNHASTSNVPPVTCIVSDGIMSFTLNVAEELGVPEVLFWTTSACGAMSYVHYSHLMERGLTPLKGGLGCTFNNVPSCLHHRSSSLAPQQDFKRWLDSKEPNSVVYVKFGSITVMTAQQLTEFAWGLANSQQTFLWVIRPDLVAGDSAILSPEFVTQTQGRGLLTSWCPQEQVLNHPSIGGFLTHSGWNSTIESVCWPFFADQQTNCRYTCTHWGIGMEIDNDVKRDDVESLVRELMEGNKNKEMKTRALEWKKRAQEAASPGGSSQLNLDKMVNEVLLSNPNNSIS